MSEQTIPLFPLNTVLVPGGILPLRIFERRYLDLVRDCSRDEKPFGVCLVIEPGNEETHATHAAIGTLAHIRDFYTLEDGLLGITAEGGQRFWLQRTWARDDGLLMGEALLLEESRTDHIPEPYGLLAHITERFTEKLDDARPDFTRDQLQDAGWVGYRLTEWLPLDNPVKQALLELSDPLERLQQLLEIVPRLQGDESDE